MATWARPGLRSREAECRWRESVVRAIARSVWQDVTLPGPCLGNHCAMDIKSTRLRSASAIWVSLNVGGGGWGGGGGGGGVWGGGGGWGGGGRFVN